MKRGEKQSNWEFYKGMCLTYLHKYLPTSIRWINKIYHGGIFTDGGMVAFSKSSNYQYYPHYHPGPTIAGTWPRFDLVMALSIHPTPSSDRQRILTYGISQEADNVP